MIKCHLARLMGEHKLNIADVARATSLNRNTITLLYKEKAVRVDFHTLNELCKYFNCEVSDILEHISDQ